MIVALVLVSLGFGIWANRYAAQMQRRAAVQGAPPIHVPGIFAQRKAFTRPSHGPRFAKPATGDDGDFDSLVAARRFREAAALLDPSDHERRSRLAVAQRAPIVDLLLAASVGSPALQNRARSIVYAIYPDDNWAFPSSPATASPDKVEEALVEATRFAAKGKLGAARKIYGRLATAYPHADASPEWQLALATLNAVLGDTELSRTWAKRADSPGSPRVVRNQAAKLAHPAWGASGEQRTVRGRSARRDLERIRGQAAKKKNPRVWPTSPHDLAALTTGRRALVERTLTRATVARALRNRQTVWVGYFRADGMSVATPVAAIDPASGAVVLADGTLIEWGELVRRSTWGDRCIVVTRGGAEVAGEPAPYAWEQLSYPVGTDGALRDDPDAIAVLRESALAHPKDAMAQYFFAAALLSAVRHRSGPGIDIETLRTHVAQSVARFPGAVWPAEILEWVAPAADHPTPAALYALATAQFHSERAGTSLARAYFAQVGAERHVREANVVDGPNGDAVIEGLARAAERWDHADMDAHLHLLTVLAGDDDDTVAHYMRSRVAMSQGYAHAVQVERSKAQSPIILDARVALGCSSGDPSVLTDALADIPEAIYLRSPRDAAVLAALHEGDIDAVVAAAATVSRVDGYSPFTVDVLAQAAIHLTSEGDPRAVAAMETAGGSALDAFIAAVEWTRPDIALAAARLPSARADRVLGHLRASRGLLRSAAKNEGDARAALLEQVRDELTSVGDSRDMLPMWPYQWAATLIESDPEQGLATMRDLTHVAQPFAAFALVAALADAAGDSDLAAHMRARAANPLLVDAGWQSAVLIGLGAELDTALNTLGSDAVSEVAWSWYGFGGSIPTFPAEFSTSGGGKHVDVLWRLAVEGHWDLLNNGIRHTWSATDAIAMTDGAERVALTALAHARAGNTSVLTDALAGSRHPAYARAAAIATSSGIALPALTAGAPTASGGDTP